MKNTVYCLLFSILLFHTQACAQNFAQHKQKTAIARPHDKLVVGERLIYATEWLGFPVGKAVLKVESITGINGRECYHISAEAVPNDFLRRFINLQYRVDSFMDTRLLCSRRFEKVRQMNNETNHVVMDFDQENGTVKYVSEGGAEAIVVSEQMRQLYEQVPPTYKIPFKTQDLVSAFYQFRVTGLKEKGEYPLSIYYHERNWKTIFKAGEPYNRDFRKLGTIQVFEVSVSSELNDFIIGRRGFKVVFSNDARRTPLEFVFNTAIGPIRCHLQQPEE